jgi:hypothetical protein
MYLHELTDYLRQELQRAGISVVVLPPDTTVEVVRKVEPTIKVCVAETSGAGSIGIVSGKATIRRAWELNSAHSRWRRPRRLQKKATAARTAAPSDPTAEIQSRRLSQPLEVAWVA